MHHSCIETNFAKFPKPGFVIDGCNLKMSRL